MRGSGSARIEPLGQTGKKRRYSQCIDDRTGVRVLRAYSKHDQKTAIQFIVHVLSKTPFQVEKVQTDKGPEFGQSFHWRVLDEGIKDVCSRPDTPCLNDKVIHNVNLFNDKLQQWEKLYK